MAYVVHFGIERERAEAAAARLSAFPDVEAVFLDGDGWEAWGEQPGADLNDLNTRHVVVQAVTLGRAIDLACDLGHPTDPIFDNLVGMEREGSGGILTVVTFMADWSGVIATCDQQGEIEFRALTTDIE